MLASHQKPPPFGAGSRKIILIALAAMAVVVLVMTRFIVIMPDATVEGPATMGHLTGAPPFGTATPVSASAQPNGTNTKFATSSTPLPAPIIAGYPDPRVDSAQDKRLRANAGNPDKVIMVSISGQSMQVFDKGQLVRWTYVTTGRPGLDTPVGTFRIYQKRSPLTFLPLSNDPSSPEYGFASKVQYGMLFRDGGFYIHDVWWRTVYGPGYNYDHYDPGRREWSPGSHGCVNTPLEMMSWLWTWADLGTTVIVSE